MEQKTPAVYAAISEVQSALAKQGIAKARRNAQQGYQFRGIDDVYSALAPLLAQHGLCILPRVLSRSVTERQTKHGAALFYTVLDVEFDIIAASDGSCHTVRTIGEAMDSGDKSCNKAQSAAYKYMALMTFAIPVEGDNDTENTTHEVMGFDLQGAIAAVNAAPDEQSVRATARSLWQGCPPTMRDALKKAVDARLASFGGAEG